MKRTEDQPTGPLQAKEAAINLTCHRPLHGGFILCRDTG